jgi:hypothetical protein
VTDLTDRHISYIRNENLAKKRKKGESSEPTPYAVWCPVHEHVFLTGAEYDSQMLQADDLWVCPREGCHSVAEWDDDVTQSEGD